MRLPPTLAPLYDPHAARAAPVPRPGRAAACSTVAPPAAPQAALLLARHTPYRRFAANSAPGAVPQSKAETSLMRALRDIFVLWRDEPCIWTGNRRGWRHRRQAHLFCPFNMSPPRVVFCSFCNQCATAVAYSLQCLFRSVIRLMQTMEPNVQSKLPTTVGIRACQEVVAHEACPKEFSSMMHIHIGTVISDGWYFQGGYLFVKFASGNRSPPQQNTSFTGVYHSCSMSPIRLPQTFLPI